MTASDGRYCTGTLVLPHVVLTAAHCLEGIGPEQLQITAGGDEHPVTRYLIHPDYRPGESAAPHPADIALVSFAASHARAPCLLSQAARCAVAKR
jgi:hypothetical protein